MEKKLYIKLLSTRNDDNFHLLEKVEKSNN